MNNETLSPKRGEKFYRHCIIICKDSNVSHVSGLHSGDLVQSLFIYESLQLLSLCKNPAGLVLCRGMFGHAAGSVRVRPQCSWMGR